MGKGRAKREQAITLQEVTAVGEVRYKQNGSGPLPLGAMSSKSCASPTLEFLHAHTKVTQHLFPDV